MSTTKPYVLLGDYLETSGRKLGMHVTIEYGGSSLRAVTSVPLKTTRVIDNGVPESIDDVVTKLRKELADVDVVRNVANPSVIHIIDSRLQTLRDYALDRRIDLTYTGLLSGLPEAIGKVTDGAVGPKRVFAVNESFGDYVTRVHLTASSKTVRDILTDCVRLHGYSVPIWNAMTWNNGGKVDTWIQYYGLARK